jgi:hypothetical protein
MNNYFLKFLNRKILFETILKESKESLINNLPEDQGYDQETKDKLVSFFKQHPNAGSKTDPTTNI